MNAITIVESDGTTQNLTSTTEYTSITGTSADGTTTVLFPVAPTGTPAPVVDPIVEIDVIAESGTETVFVPKV